MSCLKQPSVRRSHSCSRNDYPGQVCSIAKALEVVGERWSLLIVRDVMNRRRRFDELQKGLGVARNVLSARLQRLVEEDILERRAYQQNPERHEYFLTEKGLDLWPALIALLGWGDRHSPTPDGPPMLIVHKECGGPVSDRGICEQLRRGARGPRRARDPGPGLSGARERRGARGALALAGRPVGAATQEEKQMATAAELQARDKLYIGGEWVEPAGDRDDRGRSTRPPRRSMGTHPGGHAGRRRPRRRAPPRGLRVLVADRRARSAPSYLRAIAAGLGRARRGDRGDDRPGAGHAAQALRR